MMRHFGFIKTMLAAMTLACGAMAANARDQMIFDMESALVYCRETAMEGPEGIWEFAGDETQVLIKKETRGGKGYDIIVISTPDCRLSPGETIGNIQPSAKKGKYRMKLYVSRKMGTFSDSRSTAVLHGGVYRKRRCDTHTSRETQDIRAHDVVSP